LIMDDKFFNDIHEEITNAAFGKNGKCFLLIDASLEQYHSELFLPGILREYNLILLHSARKNFRGLYHFTFSLLVPPAREMVNCLRIVFTIH
ncbi:hypothetical protein, partial [Enterobacter hormaechei]|uniref:hypothetical protein n=1 Tax=Enterobacter hormaechei TaxID=158836 RepID=UPI003A96D8CC